MCGILGGVELSEPGGRLSGWQRRVPLALETLRRRGPDSQGSFADEFALLAQTRLKIIDLSAAADQPMYDPTSRYVLVYNGEVFNFIELRAELAAQGVAFATQSDTEVVLQMLIRHGERALDRFNGFFALALYDRHERSLLLARDRYGIKPLLLYQQGSSLVFGSELKALLALGIPRRLDMASLYHYLELNYVLPNASMLEGVSKLAPGTWLRWHEGQTTTGRYYDFTYRSLESVAPARDYPQAVAELRRRVERAVSLRMIADVPVGVFLSGGLDSSVVAAVAARQSPHIRTFSLAFTDPLYDETGYAHLVSSHLGTQHTTFTVSNDTLLEHLDPVFDYIDEPFADAAALNLYVLTRLARPEVTVALSGDGADELLGGYAKHVGEELAHQWSPLNATLAALSPLIDLIPSSRNTRLGRRVVQAQRYAQGVRLSARDRYWLWATTGTRAHDLLCQSPDTQRAQTRLHPLLESVTDRAGLNGVFVADYRLVMAGDMLPKVDLMSMANSLEVRSPFFDYEVIDYAMSLPQHYKIHRGHRKRILADAFRQDLPEAIYNRPKQGFEVPLAGWFRSSLRSRIERDLIDPDFLHAQGLFRPEAVHRLWQAVLTGRNRKEEWTLWALLVFQQFYRRYLISDPQPELEPAALSL